MQLKEITKGISNEEMLILKDYSLKDTFTTKVALSELTLDQLVEIANIASILGYQKLDDKISTKGYRIFNKTHLNNNELDVLIENLKMLQNFFDPSLQEKIISLIGEKRVALLTKELTKLREQVLLGKKI